MLELISLFLRLGATAFGGPAAHIAMLHDEVVLRRRWMEEQHFLDLVGATNLIPGPNSTEMVLHIGYERAGWRGLIISALCFILPAALMVGFLAWFYVKYGSTPEGTALLIGIKPVIMVIILQALLKFASQAVKGDRAEKRFLSAVGLASFGLYLFGVNELLLLLGGGLLVMVWRKGLADFISSLILLPLMIQPPTMQIPSVSAPLGQLFLVFLKVGATLYGSGYVLIAFLRNDLVLRFGWLTDQQLLDAIAIGQFTPGPLLTTSTFIGYLLGGVPGAILATLGIFLPSLLFVALLNPLVSRLRNSLWTSALLDGINVAAVGLMAGVALQLAQTSLINLPSIALALLAAILLFRYRVSSAWLVIGGGIVGLMMA